MKASSLILVLAATSLSSAGFGRSSEQSKSVVLTGKIAYEECADSDISIITVDRGEICLGFNNDHVTREDLVVGNTYTLGGELTEDGFYPNEWLMD